MARSQTERVFQHINCNRSKLFCPLKWVLWSRFCSYFEAYGTNCFNVPCKTLLPSKIHHQKHFLIAKTAAKITEQVCQWSQCRPHQKIYRNIYMGHLSLQAITIHVLCVCDEFKNHRLVRNNTIFVCITIPQFFPALLLVCARTWLCLVHIVHKASGM